MTVELHAETARSPRRDAWSARRARARRLTEDTGAVPLWLSLGGLGLGAAFAYLAGLAGGGLQTLALLTGAAAAGGLGVFGLIERLIGAGDRRASRAEDAGIAPFEAAPEPVVLVDRSGVMTAMNAAAKAAVAPAGARRLSDLVEQTGGGQASVFRLLAAAFRGAPGETRLRLLGEEDVAVSVWPVGGGLAAWRWRPRPQREDAEQDGEAGTEGAAASVDIFGGVAWMHVGAHGLILRANKVFEAWSGQPAGARSFHAVFPDAGRRFSGAAGRVERVIGRTRMIGAPGAPRAVSMLYAPAATPGEAIIVAAPAGRDESSNIAPIDSADKLLGAIDARRSVQLFEDAPIGVMVLSAEGRVLRLNAAADRLLTGDDPATPGASGRTVRVMSGKNGDLLVDWIAEEHRDDMAARILSAAEGFASGGDAFEAMIGPGDGERRITQCYLRPVDAPDGRLLLCYLIDVSERHGLEQRFMQAQKLQAVGELAGGLAHDFNNLLGIILGNSDELLQRSHEDDPAFPHLSAINQSARRGANLVRQLMAYSRRQTLRPEVANLTERLSELGFLLSKTIGSTFTLRQDLAEDLWPVRIDVLQFERVITNLALNARDAMPEGGRIALRTANDRLENGRRGHSFSMPPGEYVRVSVEDDGCGMPPEVQQKIFEPFFTTKGVGKGTGLGLSSAYGIVKQSGGYIFVESAPDEGTVFDIYLPRDRGEAAAQAASERAWTQDLEKDLENDLESGLEQGLTLDPAQDFEREPPLLPPPPGRSAPAAPLAVEDVAETLMAERRAGVAAASAPLRPAPAGDGAAGRGKAVLLVEDEMQLREMAARALRAEGYEVIETECAEDALEVLEDESVAIDLMLSDVVMPNMDGPSILRALGARRPELRTIFMSGYARDAFAETLDSTVSQARSFGFLQKPFLIKDLRAVVAEALSES